MCARSVWCAILPSAARCAIICRGDRRECLPPPPFVNNSAYRLTTYPFIVALPLLCAAPCDFGAISSASLDKWSEDLSSPADFPVSDWDGTYPNCFALSTRQDLDGRTIVSYLTYGVEDQEGPTSKYPGAGGANVKTSRVTAPCIAHTSGRSASLSSQDDVKWSATGGMDEFKNCYVSGATNECEPDESDACSGIYQVRINPAPADANDCDEFHPTRIALDTTAILRRRYPPQAEQSAGSGRFMLLPASGRDLDQDGLSHVLFIPVQVSGTGVMTNRSWITATSIVEDNGQTLRIAKTDTDLQFNANDSLLNASTVSYALTSSNQYSSGTVRGNTYFLANDMDLDDALGMEVDITWATGTGGTAATLPQGWQFSLDDIGCEWKQKFTLRYATSPNRVEIEQYGNPGFSRVEPTVTTSEGQAFAFEGYGLTIDGVLLSQSGQSATVRLDEIQFDGEDACSTGTYTFAAE